MTKKRRLELIKQLSDMSRNGWANARTDDYEPLEQELKCAAVAKAHPDWSIRQIEAFLNIRPTSDASAFRKGTKARKNEEDVYRTDLAAWKARNGKV